MRKTWIYKAVAVAAAFSFVVGSIFSGTGLQVKAEEKTYPWTKTAVSTSGDYIADSYEGVDAGHVFESVTQERLLDILSSEGTHYVVFGGPEHDTSKAVIPLINEQAKTDQIAKIYHFNPVLDGYQLDITDPDTTFKGNQGKSVYELWTKIQELLPDGALGTYTSDDTLLFAYSRKGDAVSVSASYLVTEDDLSGIASEADKAAQKTEIAKIFRGGAENGTVIAGDVRSDFDFFKRVYNASASYFNYNSGKGATANRTGEERTEIFTEEDREGFPLHQVNFNELINLLNSDGEHIIFFGASWCHNTQAIIGSVARTAKASGKQVYVYDTTIGNQLTFDTPTADIISSYSSAFNSRNNVNLENGNNTISYLYGEFVKYLGNFITENNSKQNNSIVYYPNGDLSGAVTSVNPWDEGETKNAIRLQLPFLVAYDKNAATPVTKQWLHKNAANDGTYTEYMLDLAWVKATEEAKAATDRNGAPATIDGLSYVDFAKEAVEALNYVLKDGYTGKTEDGKQTVNTTTTTNNNSSTTVTNSTANTSVNESVASNKKVKAPKITVKATKKKIKVSWKKVSGVKGYEVYRSVGKKTNFKKVKTVKSSTTSLTVKASKKKTYYFKVRSYTKDENGKKIYSAWSSVKKVKGK